MVNETGQKVLLDRCAPDLFSYIANSAFLIQSQFRKL